MKLALFTACDLNYMPGATAMLRSVARHHPEADRFCMVPESEIDEATRLLQGLAKVVSPPRMISGVVPRLQIAHAKVFASEFLAYDSVLWVDGDILFCRPAAPCWEVRPGRVTAVISTPTNRVPHNLPTELRDRFCKLYPDLSEHSGFNGGLFALRPSEWPDFQLRLETVIRKMGCENHSGYFDQPLLNAIFEGKVDYLPFEYNWTEMFDTPPSERTVKLVHFASKPKPWMPGYPKHEPGYWFWLKHGLVETNPWRLAKARLWIALNTPRRILSRYMRRLRAGSKG